MAQILPGGVDGPAATSLAMAILPCIITLYLDGRDVKSAFGLAEPQAA